MNSFYWLIFLLFASELLGQSPNKINFGVSLLPQITHQIIDDPEVIDSEIRFGYGVRGDLYVELSPLFQFNSGISYHLIRIKQKDYSLKQACDFHSTTPDIADSWYEDEFSLHYVGIPVELLVKPFGKSIPTFITMGVTPLWSVSHNGTTVSYNCLGSTLKDRDDPYLNTPQSVMVMGSFGLGQEIFVGSGIKILLEPGFGFSFDRIFNELDLERFATNDSKLISWSIRLGLIFN